MQQRSIFAYFAFGFDFSTIARSQLRSFTKNNALQYLRQFFSTCKVLELPVTEQVAEELNKIYLEIQQGEAEEISETISKRILTEIEKIDPTLSAELKLRKAFVLTKKRYPLDSLTTTPNELLAKGVHEKLCENSQRDFLSGTTLIALAQPTGAAFHFMRALEAQVKVLYFAYKKTNRLATPMWGPMTKQLKEKRAPKPSDKLLSHLDGLRVHFRNPTQHPEAFYTMDEAQDLLNQTITALNMIQAELPK